ncbi:unnamed protein product [Vicia faba]|uniref:Leucine-rich repeat-containing N-terminal plant-type domain-containing protein n=1 Tax=Vicia faba TaxID=3906 RepID=A0AAV1A8G6_VICFA|nr:unnamed protein product [Vicia faba]
MAHKTPYYCIFTLFMLSTYFVPIFGDTNGQILIRFKSFLSNNNALNNWVDESNLCNWADTLLELTNLVSFSVMNNSFEGPMPEFKKLVKLRGLYLSNNKFSGEILDNGFEGMVNLKRVFLAGNEFNGHIPFSLTSLTRLLDLDLHGNSFGGNIPEFQQNFFRIFDLSNNQLEGQIPISLSHEPLTSFSGNKGLCGKPLNPCNISPTKSNVHPNSPPSNSKK